MKIIEFESVIFYVGQNSSENDQLFNDMPNDAIWFHLASESSSHVYCVDKSGAKKLDKKCLKKGAELVKFYSKKTSKVIYTKKSNLKLIGNGLIHMLVDPKYI